ncbi:MAG: hypothetical protein RMK94_13285 [Armatimonadota bacterium]|nr:hypothetical protein [Armatimonadota bacterium]
MLQTKRILRNDFNPIVVRLRPSPLTISPFAQLWFQSHCGAIATFLF